MIDWFAAALCVGGAVVALQARQIVRGVLGLAAFFLGVAVFFGLQGAWFLALGQVFLFVGGVVTLLVLAFNITTPAPTRSSLRGGWILAVLAATLLAFALPDAPSGASVPVSELARLFFTTYGWALHAALLLLFSAVICAQYLLEDRR